MAGPLRIVHYLNQFFGQLGGEEAAGAAPQARDGAIGPGLAITKLLAQWRAAAGELAAEVVGTVICGDNYFIETPAAGDEVFALIAPCRPDLLLAGPAFNAGRYGIGCAAVCKMVGDKLGIPAVTGMDEENPGVEMYRRDVTIVRSGASARAMLPTLERMLKVALKLARGEALGPARIEGTFARGRVRNELATEPGARRAVAMLLAKLRGEPFVTEMELPRFEKVRPAPAIVDLTNARIALVTDGGLVPLGNPDGIESISATKFGVYDMGEAARLEASRYESVHRGYDVRYVNEDPQRLLPVDVLREMERERRIGRLHPRFYSTTGVATTLRNSRAIGAAMAERLKAEGVQAVILTST